MEADITSQAVGLASSADFSILNLFLRADIIVKSVMILLVASSIYSWAIIIEKYRLFKKINQSSDEFENKIYVILNVSKKGSEIFVGKWKYFKFLLSDSLHCLLHGSSQDIQGYL